jgi:hypothetical protein
MVITGWVALSCILPFLLLRKVEMDWVWSLGIAFLAYATLSSFWAPTWQQAVWDLWLTYVLAFCFVLGTTRHPRQLWMGMALALGVSDVIALFQKAGYHPLFASDSWYQAGNFVNPDMFGETAALVSIALIASRTYWPLLLTLPPIYFTQSRTVYVAYTVVIAFAVWERWRWKAIVPCLLALLTTGYFVTSRYPDSIKERVAIWEDTVDGITIFGRGAGSFFMLYPEFARRTDTMHTRPEDPHNEFLNLAFEYGIGALPLLALLALGFTASGPERYVLVAFLAIAFFSFPTRIPTEGMVGLVALGRLCRAGNIPWPNYLGWGSARAAWAACSRWRGVPLEPIRAHTRGIRRPLTGGY